ncbi:MAG TPA: CHAT domain-containing protein [Mycobacteriales bacterium]|nr:CHAT domain-containing protein [Mycobacteriales bacterium]
MLPALNGRDVSNVVMGREVIRPATGVVRGLTACGQVGEPALVEVVCGRCGSRQRAFLGEREIAFVNVPALSEVLEGRPPWSKCGSCNAALGLASRVRIHGNDWNTLVELDGSGRAQLGSELTRVIRAHLDGVIDDLQRAPGAREREAVAMARYAELTAEAVASAMIAATGLVPDVTRNPIPGGIDEVDLIVGDAQGVALVSAALALAADGTTPLQELLASHIADGVVLPGAIDSLRSSLESLLVRGGLDPTTRLCLLAVNAAAHVAAGAVDPLAAEFTRVWISWAWTAQTDHRRDILRLRLPKELPALAVDPDQIVRAVHEAVDSSGDAIARLQLIAESAGYPHLIRSVARNAPVFEAASSEVLRDALEHVAGLGEEVRLIEALRHVLGVLRSSGRSSELVGMTQYAITLSDGSETSRARLLTQLGAAAKDARAPTLFLETVGDQPQPWEADLPALERLAIDTERSTALRMTGRPTDALKVLAPYRDMTFDEDTTWRLEFNLALIERDQGDLGHGIAALDQLLQSAPDQEARFLAHQALATTATSLGRHRNAVDHLRAAITLAKGPDAEQIPTLRAHLASLLAAEGDTVGALGELNALQSDLDGGSRAALGAADAVVVLLERGEEIPEDLVQSTSNALVDLEHAAFSKGDWTVRASAIRVRARLREILGDSGGAIADLETLVTLAKDPFALAALAVLRARTGDVPAARIHLLAIPDALRDEYGATQDSSLLIDATGRLRAEMKRVSTAMMAARPAPADVRLASELSRDAIGRARAWRSGSPNPPSRQALADQLSDARLATLAPARGALWVVEWWLGEEGVVTLLSRIGSDKSIDFRALPAMPVEAPTVALEVLARLQNWWPQRPGDPLDHDGWRMLEGWLTAEMRLATHDDHLVVIEHAGLTGLPWHAMDAPWTTSYLPSWSALFDLPGPQPPVKNVGLASVPAHSDSPATLEAFARATRLIETEAARHDIGANVRDGPTVDAAAVRELLASNDIVTLLCHGLVDPEQRDLALLVGRRGALPTQHPIAAASAEGRAHRLTWNSLQDLNTAAGLVMSGACSTGQSLVAGMGERLGLFGALRSSGTRAVVAPAWDAIAEDVSEQLADIHSRVLAGSTLAAAVRATADAYDSRLPAWRSRVLCVEGDWR